MYRYKNDRNTSKTVHASMHIRITAFLLHICMSYMSCMLCMLCLHVMYAMYVMLCGLLYCTTLLYIYRLWRMKVTSTYL